MGDIYVDDKAQNDKDFFKQFSYIMRSFKFPSTNPRQYRAGLVYFIIEHLSVDLHRDLWV